MLSLVFTFGDEYAERILRDYLCARTSRTKLKRAVFGMLSTSGQRRPFMAYLKRPLDQGGA